MTSDSETTKLGARERLLSAAARLFAEHGKDKVSIRDIAAAAGVRHGGVNYHFRSKDELFVEVLRSFGPAARQAEPPLELMRSEKTPDEARAVFERIVEGIVLEFTRPVDPIALGLLHCEISKNGGPHETIFKEVIEPRHEALETLIGQMYPHLTDRRELRIAAMNVMSQCVFLFLAQPVALRLLDVEEIDEELARTYARRIVTTALEGLGAPSVAEAGGTR